VSGTPRGLADEHVNTLNFPQPRLHTAHDATSCVGTVIEERLRLASEAHTIRLRRN